jgi:hypothetical protein
LGIKSYKNFKNIETKIQEQKFQKSRNKKFKNPGTKFRNKNFKDPRTKVWEQK